MSIAPRIAIACSGLGHVQRGIEAWAYDIGQALRHAGANVTVFAGAPLEGTETLLALHRTGKTAHAMASTLRHLGGWRCGMGSAYEVEQTSFALALWRRIRHDFDILHVQDPIVALWLQRARYAGVSRPLVVYANGTGENASVMQYFPNLQLLTQATADAWMSHKPDGQSVFMIPNFIDTTRFHPGDQAACRQRFGLPPDRIVILCCAAIRRSHKRIDILLREYAAACCHDGSHDSLLVIAGGRETETDALIAEGSALLGDRVRFLPDLPRQVMPDLYRTADIFVLPSLREMFGIVLLEALATGLPVLCNDTPDFRAIAGPAGLYRDFSVQGRLAQGIRDLLQPPISWPLAQAARSHIKQHFSEAVVLPALAAMYQSVQMASSHGQ